MDCAKVRELIDPFLDGELTQEETAEVELHLRTCNQCTYESTQIIRMKEVISRWQGITPSGLVKQEVLTKVRNEVSKHGTPRERYIRRSVLSAVGLALVLVGGVISVVYVSQWSHTSTGGGAASESGKPAAATANSATGSVFARVAGLTGDDVRVIGRDGDVYRPSDRHEILPGETVEVGETSLLAVDVTGGRVLIGGIAWKGKAPSFGLSGSTRLRFASPEAGLDLARGTVRVLAAGGGVGDIRFRTPAGTIYVPWAGPGDEATEVSINVTADRAAVGVFSGEAGVLVTRAGGTTQNIPVRKGHVVETTSAGEFTDRTE